MFTSEELQNEMMDVQDKIQDKTNTFGWNSSANVKATNVHFGFYETRFQVEVHVHRFYRRKIGEK